MRTLVDDWCIAWCAVGAFDILHGIWPLHHPIAVGIALIVLAVTGRTIYQIKLKH